MVVTWPPRVCVRGFDHRECAHLTRLFHALAYQIIPLRVDARSALRPRLWMLAGTALDAVRVSVHAERTCVRERMFACTRAAVVVRWLMLVVLVIYKVS